LVKCMEKLAFECRPNRLDFGSLGWGLFSFFHKKTPLSI